MINRDNGQASIEAVLVMPALIVVFLIIVNLIMMLINQSVIIDAAMDGVMLAQDSISAGIDERLVIKRCEQNSKDILLSRLLSTEIEKISISNTQNRISFSIVCRFHPVLPGFSQLVKEGIALEYQSVLPMGAKR